MKHPRAEAFEQEFTGKEISNYKIGTFIDVGQQGAVFQATKIYLEPLEKAIVYACKIIDKSTIDDEITQIRLDLEIEIMTDYIDHNIVRCFYKHDDGKFIYLIMDFCNEGDLGKHVRDKKDSRLPEAEAIGWLQQIANGFVKLHEEKIIHRDIKFDNLLIMGGVLKLADFGISKKGDLACSGVGTPLTKAPEILKCDPWVGGTNDSNLVYNSKCDLFSVGVVYYWMLFGEHPYVNGM